MATKPPKKLFYKIGEVSEMVGVENHVLRYWETEFKQIQPSRVGSKQRLYRKKDITTFYEIKRLLYEERFTIEGTKIKLEQQEAQGLLFELDEEDFFIKEKEELSNLVQEIKKELLFLKNFLLGPSK